MLVFCVLCLSSPCRRHRAAIYFMNLVIFLFPCVLCRCFVIFSLCLCRCFVDFVVLVSLVSLSVSDVCVCVCDVGDDCVRVLCFLFCA